MWSNSAVNQSGLGAYNFGRLLIINSISLVGTDLDVLPTLLWVLENCVLKGIGPFYVHY